MQQKIDFSEYTPVLFTRIKKGISPQQLSKDIVSGVVVGIIALPLAIAFAIASGVSPEKGIITAVIAGFIISALGGSRVQIGGPTGAFIVIIFGILEKYGTNGLLTATFMAGVILIIMGLLRLGALLKYIPRTLIVGFTTGIAIIIFTTQVKDFLGLSINDVPADFAGKWLSYLGSLDTVNPWAVLTGLLSVAVILVLQRINRKIPGPLAAILITTLLVFFLKLPVDTISSRFGSLSGSFPPAVLPELGLERVIFLFKPALSIALLGALESLLSAVVADGMIGSRHRPNIELIAQGLANIASPLFGGLPATGAIARTAANVKNGARTPVAGMVHSLVLLFIFLVAMPLVKYIPIPALSGILIIVSWNMSELKAFRRVFNINIYEVLVLLATFFLTLFADITTAILVGFSLSILLFMKRMSDSVNITPLVSTRRGDGTIFSEELGVVSDSILIFEVDGPLFFGSVAELLNIEKHLSSPHRIVILRMRYVPILDSTGLNRLHEINRELERKGIRLLVSGASETVKAKIINLGVLETDYVKSDIEAALKKAEEIISKG